MRFSFINKLMNLGHSSNPMFESFRRGSSIDEKLIKMKNTLDTATYEDDKIETLTKINDIIHLNHSRVFGICIESILQSMQTMETIAIHFKIIETFVELGYKDKIVQLFINQNNLEILKSRPPSDISKILNILDSEKIYLSLANDQNIYSIFVNLFHEGYLRHVKKFLLLDNNLRTIVIFEGFMELVISNLYKSDDYYKILYLIVNNSIKAQTYFMSSDLFLNFSKLTHNDFDIFCSILNPLNEKFHSYQSYFFTINFISKALEYKRYDFLLKLIIFNDKNLQNFVSKYLILDDLIVDSQNCISALSIIEIILTSSNSEFLERFKYTQSYRIGIILHQMGFKEFDFEVKLQDDLNKNKITIDLLLFIIFTRENCTDVVIENFEDDFLADLYFLMKLLNSKSMEPSLYTLHVLYRLRSYLLNNNICLESQREILLDTISNLIKTNTHICERIDTQLINKPKEIQNEAYEEPKAALRDISRDSKSSKLMDVFYHIKKSFHEQDSFDL